MNGLPRRQAPRKRYTAPRVTQLPRILLRIYAAIAVLLGMTLFGSIGFYWLAGDQANLSDALHMTLISITTVGYGETIPLESLGERLYADMIALLGFGTVTFLFASLAAFFMESDFDYSLRRRRMEKAISKLSGHYLLCGYGQVGRNVAAELEASHRVFVAIDNDEHQFDTLHEQQPSRLSLHGDATDDDLLLTAGINEAAGVFALTGDDSRNLMIILTARQLNPNIRVVARCHEMRNMQKMKKAGADTVISPDFTGGMRIASSMIRPHVVNFLDEMLRSEHSVRLEEVHVPADHSALSFAQLKQRCPSCVILSLRQDQNFVFNPADELLLQAGQVLIAMISGQGHEELHAALHS